MKWPDGTGEQLLYYDYLTRYGATARDRSIARTKQDFERFVVDDPAYQEDCTRNGTPQRFLITRTDSLIRCEITAFPGEELYPGDIIEMLRRALDLLPDPGQQRHPGHRHHMAVQPPLPLAERHT